MESYTIKGVFSVWVTKLPFEFTASLNKIVLILHRNVFSLLLLLLFDVHIFQTWRLLFHSNVFLSLMLQYILNNDKQGIHFSTNINL